MLCLKLIPVNDEPNIYLCVHSAHLLDIDGTELTYSCEIEIVKLSFIFIFFRSYDYIIIIFIG